MRNKYYYFMILLFLDLIILLSFNVYGLDEFVDNYTDETYIQAKYQIVRNTTFNAMELEYGMSGTYYENFSTYTETDSENDITVYDYNITWDRMDRLCDASVIYDYGASHFGLNWEHHFEVKFTELEAGDASFRNQIHLYQVSASGIGEMFRFTTVQNGADDTTIVFSFLQKSGGINQFVDTNFLADVGKTYWINITKTNTLFNFQVYNDSSFNIAFREYDNSMVGLHISYRNINCTSSINNANDPDDYSSGYIKLLNLNEGGESTAYYDEGTFYTTNLLENLNNESIVLLYNCSLNGGTIESEYSNDNSTWVNHNGVGGSDNLVDGFESIDLRDLDYNILYTRFNYTRGEEQTTPRLYQLIIHTDDVVEGEEYSALFIVGFVVGLILMVGIAFKK